MVSFKDKVSLKILKYINIIEPKPIHIVNTTLDLPEGAEFTDNDDSDGKFDPDDPHRALNIELDM